ncbi:MAG TPA: hypothetical protein VFS43_33420 [Polyangiaceae bacterium]|nr:hypothetical protein [Polyangiaceae bacterium]
MQREIELQTGVGRGFLENFRRWARRVRRRLLGRVLLTGLGVGLSAAALVALGLWRAGAAGRPVAAGVAALVGLGAALAVALRRRWSDQEVALYLDGRLGSDEVVTTALGLGAEGAGGAAVEGGDEARAVVLERAEKALAEADPRRLGPRLWSRAHLLAPVGALALAYALSLPPRPAAKAAAPPGLDRVTLADVRGLERVAELGSIAARDDEQRRRLDAIARDARALREKLEKGVEKREAQAEIARMRDALRAERMSLGDGERRAGLEGALERLAREPLTSSAAKALGDGDLVRFDEAMQELANRREESDRERAKKALEEAAEAAKRAGAPDVAKALKDQKDLLGERGERADELRALGDALGEGLSDEERRALSDFGRMPNDANARKLAESLQKSLERLTPEERKRLAERLKKRLRPGQPGGPDAASREKMRELAEQLGTEEGRKRLEDELRELANEDTDDDEAERQRRLDEAERGLGEGNGGEGQGQGQGQGQGDMPVPVPGPGGPGSGPDNKGGQPGGGPGEGGGKGEHAGESKPVDAAELRSRAGARWRGGAPPGGISVGRAAGRAGETANVRGTGALGTVGPGEMNGVDRTAVPEEYREQVGRYFQP